MLTRSPKMMLILCEQQFRMYAANHLAKVQKFKNQIKEYEDNSLSIVKAREILDLELAITDTANKAGVNEQFADDIAAVLNQREHDVLTQTADFANIAYAEGISPKNQQTQIGVHFEEVAEMIAEVRSDNGSTVELLAHAHIAMCQLATNLKGTEPSITIHDPLAFLDACCDQLVTATLCAKLQGMDPVGGLREVNRSNYSKLTNGVMVKHPQTAKWLKGPNYSQPNLSPFI